MADMVVYDVPMARLNITWSGQNGDNPDLVPWDSSDADIRRIATEAVCTGYVAGIPADPNVDFTDFVVDRFPATDELPYRCFVRSKTPFGGFTRLTRIVALVR
jgi:hypothetical protein